MIHPQGLGAHEAFREGSQPVFDPSKLLWDSNSQGGIMGGALTALAPDYENAVLGVPGMNYSVLLRRSIDWDTYSAVLYPQYPNERRPFFGIPAIGGFPFTGDAAMVYWDTGPVRTVNGETVGTDPAPLAEVPNRSGADPHGRPRKDPFAQDQKVEFMLNGRVVDVCGAGPCYVDGYTGP